MTKKPSVSVLISTYKRAHTLSYVFNGLKNQTYGDFEVVVVLKPSGDGTEQVVEKYGKLLNINLILQKKGNVIDAYNLGLEHAKGDIIVFLDDDAIPLPNWMKEYVKTYKKLNIGGMAGDVIPAVLTKGRPIPLKINASDVIPNYSLPLKSMGYKLWDHPIEGLENHLIYITKGGRIAKNVDYRNRGTVKSLLGMGANMSILAEAARGFRFPTPWKWGLVGWEQWLGWHLWKKGYSLVFNPTAKVYHLVHGKTMTRYIKDKREVFLHVVENQLLFYHLHDLEKRFSKMHRIVSLIFYTIVYLKKMADDPDNITILKGIFLGNLIRLKGLISRKFGLHYSIIRDLEAIAIKNH